MSKKKDAVAVEAPTPGEDAPAQVPEVVPPDTDQAPSPDGDQKAPPPEQSDTRAEFVLARVLVLCDLGCPDDVVEVQESELAGLAGIVDSDTAAVAYAQSLKA